MNRPLVKYAILLLVMLGGCFADFQSKKWAQSNLKAKPSITIIKGMLDFGFTENRGMIFGILNNSMPVPAKTILVNFRILILIGLMVFIGMYRAKSLFFLIPFSLFWAGAVGNLIDPFLYGYVVDFIHIQLGPVLNWPFFFNLADAYVTVGIVLLLFQNQLTAKVPQKPGNA